MLCQLSDRGASRVCVWWLCCTLLHVTTCNNGHLFANIAGMIVVNLRGAGTGSRMQNVGKHHAGNYITGLHFVRSQ